MPPDSDDPNAHAQQALRLAQQAMAQALVLATQNAVAAQQIMQTLTIAITARLASETSEAAVSGLRAALDELRSHDPVAQLAQLAALVQQMQQTAAPQ